MRPIRPLVANRAAAACARMRMDVGGAAVPSADVVIEAIVEDVAAKRALYAAIEPQFKPGALLATTTSSIRITTSVTALRELEQSAGERFRADRGWDELSL